MIHIHEYPICEYDEERDAIIRAADFLERCLPEKCVITGNGQNLEIHYLEEDGEKRILYIKELEN